MVEKKARNAKILNLRKSGKTYMQIAIEFGISVERARQIYIRESRKERFLKDRKSNPQDEWMVWEIGTRAKNLLMRNRIYTKEFFIECLKDKNGAGIKGPIGKATIKELEQFVGFELAAERANIPRYGSVTVLKQAVVI